MFYEFGFPFLDLLLTCITELVLPSEVFDQRTSRPFDPTIDEMEQVKHVILGRAR